MMVLPPATNVGEKHHALSRERLPGTQNSIPGEAVPNTYTGKGGSKRRLTLRKLRPIRSRCCWGLRMPRLPGNALSLVGLCQAKAVPTAHPEQLATIKDSEALAWCSLLSEETR